MSVRPLQNPIENTIEVNVKGRWIRVPALDVAGNSVIVKGRWLRIGMIHDEIWLENEVEDPEQFVKSLRECSSRALRADIFTFSQKVPATTPKYPYPVEWESIAAIRAT